MFLISTATNYRLASEKTVYEVMYSSRTLVVVSVRAIAEKDRFAENMHRLNEKFKPNVRGKLAA